MYIVYIRCLTQGIPYILDIDIYIYSSSMSAQALLMAASKSATVALPIFTSKATSRLWQRWLKTARGEQRLNPVPASKSREQFLTRSRARSWCEKCKKCEKDKQIVIYIAVVDFKCITVLYCSVYI